LNSLHNKTVKKSKKKHTYRPRIAHKYLPSARPDAIDRLLPNRPQNWQERSSIWDGRPWPQ